MLRKPAFTLSACVAAIIWAMPAHAQDPGTAAPAMPNPQDVLGKDMVTVGVGAALVPDYDGSNDERLIPAAAIRGTYHGFSFSTRGLYLYIDAVPRGDTFDFDAGPIVGVRLDRTRRVKDDIVNLLPRRNTAYEGGGFVGVSLHRITNPYDTLAFRVDVLHDFGDAHESTVFSPNIDFSTPLSLKTYASLSIGAQFVSNKFADYYFSIDPADSLASGLPLFDADGGMKNWKAGLLLNQSITGNLLGGASLFGTAQYSRLVGDFRQAPTVADRGSPNQWLLAAGLAYTW